MAVHDEILSQLNWRYATKKFDPSKKIDSKSFSTIQNSAILSASSYGLQPWKFLVVQNAEIRDQLVSVSWNQMQVKDCSHLLVILALKNIDESYIQKYIDRIVEVRKIPSDKVNALDGYKEMMVSHLTKRMSEEERVNWAKNQCYIALGSILQTAAMLNIDACPMEGFSAADYNRILKLEASNYTTTLVCPLGYRADDDIYAGYAKVRFDEKDLVEYIE